MQNVSISFTEIKAQIPATRLATICEYKSKKGMSTRVFRTSGVQKSIMKTSMISFLRGWSFGGAMERWKSRKAKSLKSGEIRKGQLEGEGGEEVDDL